MSAVKNAGLAVVLASLTACGGDPAAGPSGVQDQVTTRPVGAGEGASVASVGGAATAAAVTVAADWGVAGNDVDLYVTGADCFDVPSALSIWSCLTVAEATGASSKPERLTFTAAAGASYKVLVLNRGSQPDTVTVTVTVR
jgi:hypothetical protein